MVQIWELDFTIKENLRNWGK